MAAWDLLVLSLAAAEAWSLPAPQCILVERRFESALLDCASDSCNGDNAAQSATCAGYSSHRRSSSSVAADAATICIRAFPTGAARAAWTVVPNQRGRVRLGPVYLRYRGALGLVERWAVAKLEQDVRVYAEMEREGEMALYLARVRQMEQQKRKLRMKGIGREFESLRDYQPGDEMRNVSWTATARRGQADHAAVYGRTQPAGVDGAGCRKALADQLSASAPGAKASREWERARAAPGTSCAGAGSDTDPVANQAGALHVTQLDQAAAAAAALAQVVMQSGDKVGLLAYGRGMQQRVLPGAGTGHLRRIIEALAEVRSEPAEANHMQAALQLLRLQPRRGLIVWITEMGETAYRPETVDAAAELSRRHLVVLLLLRHPEMKCARGDATRKCKRDVRGNSGTRGGGARRIAGGAAADRRSAGAGDHAGRGESCSLKRVSCREGSRASVMGAPATAGGHLRPARD